MCGHSIIPDFTFDITKRRINSVQTEGYMRKVIGTLDSFAVAGFVGKL